MANTSRILTAAMVLLAMTAPTDASAQGRVLPKDASNKDLISLAGIQHQIRQMPRHVLMGYDKAVLQVPRSRQATVRRIMSQSLDADQLERRVSTRLSQELPREHAAKVREWLRSDLGRKLAEMEDLAWSPQAAPQRDAFVAKLSGSPTGPFRQQLIRRIDQVTGTTETLLESAELAAFAAAMAMDSTRPKDERVGEDRIRVQIDQDRQTTRERCQSITAATFVFAYQSLSDSDLEHYAEFLESDAGQAYHRIAGSALNDALYDQVERLSRGLAAMIQNPKG